MKNHDNITKMIEEVTNRLRHVLDYLPFSTVGVNLKSYSCHSDQKEFCHFMMGVTTAPMRISVEHPVKVIPLKERWVRHVEGYLLGFECWEIFLIKEDQKLSWFSRYAEFRAFPKVKGPYQLESVESYLKPITSWEKFAETLGFDPTDKILNSVEGWIYLQISELTRRTESLKSLRSEFDRVFLDRQGERIESLQEK